jgi:hypothetical protein
MFGFEIEVSDDSSYVASHNKYDSWCKDNANGEFIVSKFSHGSVNIIFDNEEDALFFMLTFGGTIKDPPITTIIENKFKEMNSK